MKKFEVKLRCCSSAVIQMLFAILVATKEKSTFGYEGYHSLTDLLSVDGSVSVSSLLQCLQPILELFSLFNL